MSERTDVLVIGAGLAGLSAARRLVEAGARVTLATFGTGGLPLSPGVVDVLGYAPDRIARPLDALAALPDPHPYRTIGVDPVRAGVADLLRWAGPELLHPGDGEANRSVVTALGVLRPTAVVPPSMVAADLRDGQRVLCAGVTQDKDFYAEHCAANLRRALPGSDVRAVEVDIAARGGEADTTALHLANALDTAEVRERLVRALAPHVRDVDVVLLPAILGHRDLSVPGWLAEALGVAVAEVPCLPPSVPGIRLNDRLVHDLKAARVRWILGSRVLGCTVEGGRVTGVDLGTTGHVTTLRPAHVVLATGGFESGGLVMDSYGALSEPTLGLPVEAPAGELVHGDYLGREMPLFRAGLRVDAAMRPVDPATGEPVATNLHAVGGLLAGAMRWTELSGEGIALGSARAASDSILGGTR